MLKRRLIPKLQMRLSQVGTKEKMVLVTTKNFSSYHEIGDPVSQAKIYQAQAADELIFVDIDPETHGKQVLVDVIAKVSEEIFMPITVGGGVKSLEDFRVFLKNGADKVTINTAAVKNPNLINDAADAYGSSTVVVSIDYRFKNGRYEVWINGGKDKTGLDAFDWAVEAEKRGAGEILLTSIDRDGTRDGLELALTRRVAEAVSIPVITSGGCGRASHFVAGFLEGGASAVASGTYFSFRDENPMQTRAQIRNAGIAIRLHS